MKNIWCLVLERTIPFNGCGGGDENNGLPSNIWKPTDNIKTPVW